MSWKFNKIPYVAYTYWDGNSKMSYLNFLTFVSLRKYNPNLPIILYTSKDNSSLERTWTTDEHSLVYSGKDYLEECKNYVTEIREIDFTQKFGLENLHPVHKADIMRMWILYELGGIWFDTDILFIKPLTELCDEKYHVFYNSCGLDNVDLSLVYNEDKSRKIVENNDVKMFVDLSYYSTGFLMSKSNHIFYKKIYDYVISKHKNNIYQESGPNVMNKLYPDFSCVIFLHIISNIYYKTFYSIYPDMCELYYNNSAYDCNKDNIIGFHWFNGDVKSEIYRDFLTENNIFNETTFIARIIKDYVI
jgi:hypothetical protein